MKTYIIKSGDTLSKIAKQFNVTVTYLQTINNITNPNLIKVGQIIKIEEEFEISKNNTELAQKVKRFISFLESKKIQRILTPQQKNNISDLIFTSVELGITDIRMIAYLLATVHWETDKTYLPIEEYGKGRNKSYGIPHKITGKAYYGRGYCQITWYDNYERFTKILKKYNINVDLVKNPEKALDPQIAKYIIIHGMKEGSFTGRKLSDYFDDNKTDWYNARRIINGVDKAVIIKDIATEFYYELKI